MLLWRRRSLNEIVCIHFKGIVFQIEEVTARKEELASLIRRSSPDLQLLRLFEDCSLKSVFSPSPPPAWGDACAHSCAGTRVSHVPRQINIAYLLWYMTVTPGLSCSYLAVPFLLALSMKGRLTVLGIGHWSQEEPVCRFFWQPEHLGHISSQMW